MVNDYSWLVIKYNYFVYAKNYILNVSYHESLMKHVYIMRYHK